MAQVGQTSETWSKSEQTCEQKRANMRASVSMRVRVRGGGAILAALILRLGDWTGTPVGLTYS